MVDDADLIRRIGELVDEEHRLETAHQSDGLGAEELQRLRRLDVSLDQAWDLLRRRRARRLAGGDPDTEEPRPPEDVERYVQ